MNEVINAILTRISVRKFTDQRIEDEKLKLIADCAKAAPTGKNRQARKFTIVHNREKIQQLAQAIAKVHNRSDYRIYDCDAILLISFAEDDIYGQCDSSCAIENTYLAAESLGWVPSGLTNCVINVMNRKSGRYSTPFIFRTII